MTVEKVPVVTVAILAYKNPLELEACLKSVLKQIALVSFEILVIDNNEVATVLPIEFKGVQVIKSEKNNLASARNLALQWAKGRYLLFLDSDCTVDPSWLASAYDRIIQLQAQYDDVVAVGGGSYVPSGNGIIKDLMHLTYSVPILSLNSPQAYSGTKIRQTDHLPTMNAIFDREILKKIQFDERFKFCAEDLDFGFKLNSAGFKMFYSPGFAVAHHINKNFCGWVNRIFNFGASQASVIVKNKKILGRHILILLWIACFIATMTIDIRFGIVYVFAHLLFCLVVSLNELVPVRGHYFFLPFFAFATHCTYALGFLFGPYKCLMQRKRAKV